MSLLWRWAEKYPEQGQIFSRVRNCWEESSFLLLRPNLGSVLCALKQSNSSRETPFKSCCEKGRSFASSPKTDFCFTTTWGSQAPLTASFGHLSLPSPEVWIQYYSSLCPCLLMPMMQGCCLARCFRILPWPLFRGHAEAVFSVSSTPAFTLSWAFLPPAPRVPVSYMPLRCT